VREQKRARAQRFKPPASPPARDWLARKQGCQGWPGCSNGLSSKRLGACLRRFSLISTWHETSNLKQSIVRLRLVINQIRASLTTEP
jgi:hypothetical protein